MKKAVFVIGIILLIVLGYVVTGPYFTIWAIKKGIIEQDPKKLSENIDFSALRQNLKNQLNAEMIKNANNALTNDPFSALEDIFTNKVMNEIVDSFVTPSGLAALIESGKPSNRIAKTKETFSKENELFKNARFSFDSINRFSICIPNNKGEELRLVLQREGLAWKLVNIIPPRDKENSYLSNYISAKEKSNPRNISLIIKHMVDRNIHFKPKIFLKLDPFIVRLSSSNGIHFLKVNFWIQFYNKNDKTFALDVLPNIRAAIIKYLSHLSYENILKGKIDIKVSILNLLNNIFHAKRVKHVFIFDLKIQ